MNKYNISPKAKEAVKLIGFICICAGFILVWFIIVRRVFSPPEPVAETSRVEAPAHLPSITEIQQMINDRGYTIKVDGMVCGACYNPDHSETQENWDLAYNDQCAREVRN